MARVVGMVEAKTKLAELVGQVKFGGQRFVLERRGRPMAVLISVDEYESLKAQAAGRGESDVSPLSPELRRRQEGLLARARKLQAQFGAPEERLTQFLADLPPAEDEFWFQVQEVD